MSPSPDRVTDADESTMEAYALRLLATREHSRKELDAKLGARFPRERRVADLVSRLARRGLQSDQRFAEQFADQRYRKGFGPLRIRAELAQRGIDADLVSRVLTEGVFDWAARLAEVARRRFDAHPVRDPRELARRGRFLAQRGFPQGLIRRYFDSANRHD